MILSKLDQARREMQQLLIRVVPVVPGDLVVLAVRVVVALLRAAHLVAAAKHRDSLREKERCEEVSDLTISQRVDVRVVRRPLVAAVPGSVVALAVAILLAV